MLCAASVFVDSFIRYVAQTGRLGYAAAPVFSLPVCSPAPVDGSVDGVFSVVAFGVGAVEVLVVPTDSASAPAAFCSPSCCGTAFSLSRTTFVNGFGVSGTSESGSVDAWTLSVDSGSAVRFVVDVVVAVDPPPVTASSPSWIAPGILVAVATTSAGGGKSRAGSYLLGSAGIGLPPG